MWSQWTLGSIFTNKASGSDGVPPELFKILKDDAVKSAALNMSENLEISAVAAGLEKFTFHSNPKKSTAKECLNYCTIAFISHASKVVLRILPVRLKQYMNWEFPSVQAGFRQDRRTRDQIVNICWIIEKTRECTKTSTSASLTAQKLLTVQITTNCENFLEIGIPDHLTCFLRILYVGQEATVRTRPGTTDWFKTGKGLWQGCMLSPCLFSLYAEYIIWNAGLGESQAGIKTAGRNTKSLICAYDTPLMAESEEELKSLLRVKEGSEKAGLKLSIQKLRTWHLIPSLHGKYKGGNSKQWQVFFPWAPKSLQMVIAAMKFKDTCSWEGKLWQT